MADQDPPAPSVPPELAELRHSIDNIDTAVLHLLAERFKCTQKVGQLKARLNLPPADPVREVDLMLMAVKLHLPPGQSRTQPSCELLHRFDLSPARSS